MLLEVCIKHLKFAPPPLCLISFAQKLRNFNIFLQSKAQLHGHKYRFTVISELQTVVPVSFKAKGKTMLA